jgi:hypothetical protein
VVADCRAYGIQLVTLTGVAGMFGGLTPTELRREAEQQTGLRGVRAQHGTRSSRSSSRSKPAARSVTR